LRTLSGTFTALACIWNLGLLVGTVLACCLGGEGLCKRGATGFIVLSRCGFMIFVIIGRRGILGFIWRGRPMGGPSKRGPGENTMGE